MAKNKGNKEAVDESVEDAEVVDTVADDGEETVDKKPSDKPNNVPAKDKGAPRADDKRSSGKDKKKDGKKKESGKFRRKAKDFFSELKKVTWPSFTKVLKQTGVVLVVTLCFLLVMMLFDYVFGLMYKALIGGLGGGDTAAAVTAMVRMVVFRGGLL